MQHDRTVQTDKPAKGQFDEITGILKTERHVTLKEMDEVIRRRGAEHGRFSVTGDIFDRFITACNNASGPNEALRNAALQTEKMDIR